MSVNKQITIRRSPGNRQNSGKSRKAGGNGRELNVVPVVDHVVFFKNIIPTRVATRLRYLVSGILTNVIGTSASRQMQANGLYDVDPLLASTAIPGFVEMMSFFRRFRVIRVKARVTAINLETFPVIMNLSMEPTFFAADTKTLNYFEGSLNKNTMIGRGNGAPPAILGMSHTAEEIVGDANVYTDQSYTGTNVANPASLFYNTLAISTNTATLLVAGINFRWELEFDVEFYERRPLFN